MHFRVRRLTAVLCAASTPGTTSKVSTSLLGLTFLCTRPSTQRRVSPAIVHFVAMHVYPDVVVVVVDVLVYCP